MDFGTLGRHGRRRSPRSIPRPANPAALMSNVEIRNLKDHLGEAVTVRGWVETTRGHGKIAFAVVRDGTGVMQGVFVQKEIDPAVFEAHGTLTQECTVAMSGEVRAGLDKILAGESDMLSLLARVRELAPSGQRTRIHGNYALDELRLIEGEFFILDLSGDHTRPMSERRLKAPPLRDVAEMLRSLHYASLAAAGSVDESFAHAERWYRMVGERFVQTYVEATAGSALLPTEAASIDALLAAFELSKAMREVSWELLNRPAWITAALRGALRMIE